MDRAVVQSIRDVEGRRKYLNEKERQYFIECIDELTPLRRLFCLMLFWSGARISEMLYFEVHQIDFAANTIYIQTLKQRRKGIFRPIPMPARLISELGKYLENNEIISGRIWPFSRRTASRFIKGAMEDAGISGPQSSAKGLRHSFGVHCVLSGVPLHLIKKWMGHASFSTTEIYLQFTSKEERCIAERMWDT